MPRPIQPHVVVTEVKLSLHDISIQKIKDITIFLPGILMIKEVCDLIGEHVNKQTNIASSIKQLNGNSIMW